MFIMTQLNSLHTPIMWDEGVESLHVKGGLHNTTGQKIYFVFYKRSIFLHVGIEYFINKDGKRRKYRVFTGDNEVPRWTTQPLVNLQQYVEYRRKEFSTSTKLEIYFP